MPYPSTYQATEYAYNELHYHIHLVNYYINRKYHIIIHNLLD